MSDDGPGAREIAERVFAAEFDDASLSYSESDEERAPNYVVMPTGARVNRLFVAGVLTEVERVNDETRRGRVVDPSGAFVTYAGQYQPEAQAFLERAEPPEFVALTGKARTFEPEDGDRVFTSVRPESLNEVDADTRDRWVVSAAEATLDRLAIFETALDSELRGDTLRTALESGGAPASLAAGIPKAIEHYDTSTAYVEAIRRLAVDALQMIAGDRDDVRPPDFAPDAGGAASIGALPETDVTVEPPTEAVVEEATTDESAAATDSDAAEELADASDTAGAETATESEVNTEAAQSPTADADAGSESGGADADAGSEPASAAAETGSGELGDFDAGSEDSSVEESAADDSAVDDTAEDSTADVDLDADAASEPASDEMYELDEAEREEIESEFGTDFSTGTEVDEPGEADIDVPDPEEMAETPDAADAAGTAEATPDESADDTETADETELSDASAPDEPDTDEDEGDDEDADVDLEAAAIEAMGALDDGDGADRDAVVETVVEDHGVAADAVEDAIQDALMSGKCYEPGDGVLKPI